jgi:hypothetical protein
MNNRIFGVIGMLVGGGLVAHWWFGGASAAGGGSEVGSQATQAYLAVFGAVLFVSGFSALFKKSPRNPWSKR